MEPADRIFNVERTPSTGLHPAVVIPTRLVSGLLCGLLSPLLPSVLSFLLFPVVPVAGTIALAYRLLVPCIIRTDREGFTMEILRNSLNLRRGEERWNWTELRQFQYSGGRSMVLRLWREDGSKLQLSHGDFGRLHEYLKQFFPEKEKQSWF